MSEERSSIGYDRLFELQERKQRRRQRAAASVPVLVKPKRHTTFHLTIEAHQILEEMLLELRRLADRYGLPRPNKSVMVEALIREAAEQARLDPRRVLNWYMSRREEMGEEDEASGSTS
jgi:hypothetical protein